MKDTIIVFVGEKGDEIVDSNRESERKFEILNKIKAKTKKTTTTTNNNYNYNNKSHLSQYKNQRVNKLVKFG
jgi:hypothetical protein